MGNSCTCIKDANESEFETYKFKGDKMAMIIKIQSAMRGYMARKQLQKLK